MEKEPAELLKPVRAFALLDISKSKGYEGIQKGEIPSTRVAGQLRVPRSFVEQKVREALAQANSAD